MSLTQHPERCTSLLLLFLARDNGIIQLWQTIDTSTKFGTNLNEL